MGGVQVYQGAIDDWFQIFLVNKFQIPHPPPFQTLIVIQNIPSLGQRSNAPPISINFNFAFTFVLDISVHF